MNTGSYRFGRYEIQKRLGRGGMAEVWKALDTQLQRYVAIKVLRPDLRADPNFTMRFEREAQLIAALHHPNIVQIYDFQITDIEGTAEGPAAYMIMDYVEGPTLAQHLYKTMRRGQTLSMGELLQIFTPICHAIDYAHKKGMVHRDLNPANILLDERNRGNSPAGEPIVTDFGISKMLNDQTQTQHGFWLGTPAYIAPEQVLGERTSAQSDIYALAIMLYETCTGTLPFHADGPIALAMQHVQGNPTPPNLINSRISPALSDVILQGMEKDPSRRFVTASALLRALTNALEIPRMITGSTSVNNTASNEVKIPAYLMPQDQALMPAMDQPGSRAYAMTFLPSHVAVPTVEESSIVPKAPGPPDKKKGRRALLIGGLICLLIVALVGSAFIVTTRSPVVAQENIVGTVNFINSEQYNRDGSAGITDEVQISFSRLPSPDAGKAYYVWLLSDARQKTEQSLLLGRLTVQNGQSYLLYMGDAKHSNILISYCRLVLSMESASVVPVQPGPTSMWRGYGEIANIPIPSATIDHYSLLDHLRHLMSEDHGMASIDLHGGLNLWLVRNSQKLLESASGARDETNAQLARRQIVRCLQYLDGKTYSAVDVPPGTPMYIDPQAGQVGLLTFSSEQPLLGLLTHIIKHLEGLIQAPQATDKQIKLANQLSLEAKLAEKELTQAHDDARQLMAIKDAQLASSKAHILLNDLYQHINQAYTGQKDMATGELKGGVEQMSVQILQLATITIKPYKQA